MLASLLSAAVAEVLHHLLLRGDDRKVLEYVLVLLLYHGHRLGLPRGQVDHHRRIAEVHREGLACCVYPGRRRGLEVADDDGLLEVGRGLRGEARVIWSTDGHPARLEVLPADQSCRLEVVLHSLQPLEVDLGVEEEFRGLGGQLFKYRRHIRLRLLVVYLVIKAGAGGLTGGKPHKVGILQGEVGGVVVVVILLVGQESHAVPWPGTEFIREVSGAADAALWAGDGEGLRPGPDFGGEAEDLVDLLQAQLDVLGRAGDGGEQHAELLLPRHLGLQKRKR